VTQQEFDELSHLGIYPWHDDVRAAIARRTEGIERLRVTAPNIPGPSEDG
jgi:hypothetical protein